MNEIDSFSADYTSRKLSARFFGIIDERPACVTTDVNQKDWDAVVENPESLELSFVPLDHQIVIHPTPETTYSLCDCMLYQEAHWLALVELKDQAKGWLEDAIGQLKSTIKLIRENPKTSEYSLREAYAANRQHPTFRHSAKSRMNEFRNETKFRLIITNRIKAK